MSESKNKPTGKLPNDYKQTLNLPQTSFPMKADLAQKEPLWLQKWDQMHLYETIAAQNRNKTPFLLHDGPPYANGNIHFGHILNKTLKDIILKYKNMSGYYCPYIPGWDCHGLPIEHQVDKDLGPKKKGMSRLEIRQACRKYAERYVDLQRNDFKRLGILADWDHPYLTMNYDYEATIAREFGRFVAEGSIYKGLKPVLWCPHCRTALAEAEVEYEDHESDSIYVAFEITEDLGLPKLKGKKVFVVIWTTTPWTIPANLAIALHPNFDYVALEHQDRVYLVAKNLLGEFTKLLGLSEEPTILDRFAPKSLEKKTARHPFLNRTSLLVLSKHVTLDRGTGCVHIAPGHGEEDHQVGLHYGLETFTPVDDAGRFTAAVGVAEWVGKKVHEANPLVIQKLREGGHLVWSGKISHSYPHCWRCKNPVIFRATKQWFLSLEHKDLRGRCLDAIRKVKWIPAWGRDRIYNMVEKRPDWCLSRQRSWGVPIPALHCRSCGQHLLDLKIIEKATELFTQSGADVWFSEPVERFIPPGTPCPSCQKSDWEKEADILDVWFDSGVSYASVLENKLGYPADLYLEGSDQHRGWFHSSLLASMGTRGSPPYQSVLTHGFVVDGEGKKYSKSAKNYLPPEQVLKKYGADILRLWVAAEDYRHDIRVSDEILNRLIEAYRKIRNTARFLLGNLFDYDPSTMAVDVAHMPQIDQWMLHHLQKLITRTSQAYEEYNFHVIFHELNRFCTVTLSAFYLDILKDRLYTAGGLPRRSAQTVLFEITSVLARLMAPILSFTGEEIWQHLPQFSGKKPSVHLESLPTSNPKFINEALANRWERFEEIRGEILKVLERARQAKIIGNSLEAKVVLIATGEPENILEPLKQDLPGLLLVSQVEWGTNLAAEATPTERFPTLYVEVKPAEGQKCERCWTWSTEISPKNICPKCVEVLSA